MVSHFRRRAFLSGLALLVGASSALAITPTGRLTGNNSSAASLLEQKATKSTNKYQSAWEYAANSSKVTKPLTEAKFTSRTASAPGGITGFGIGAGSSPAQHSDSVWLELSDTEIDVVPGQSNTEVFASVHSNPNYDHGSVFIVSVGEPDFLSVAPLGGLLTTTGRTIRVKPDANAPLGTYVVEFFAFFYEDGDAYSDYIELTINVVAATTTPNDPVDSTNDFAMVEFSTLPAGQVDWAMYNSGFASVGTMFAVHDQNADALVDGYQANPNVVYPAFPNGSGGLNSGARFAYNSVYGQADVIVAANLNGTNDQWIVLHLNHDTVNGTDVFYPVMMMVVNYATNQMMIQDSSGWDHNFSGSLPTASSNGSVSGYIRATPFGIDPTAQPVFETFGNEVEFNFSLTLTAE